MNLQMTLIAIVLLLMCIAIIYIALRAIKQWNKPQRDYQAKMEDIQRRKRALGIADEE